MKKIAWIADTTASLSHAFIEAHNIHVIPLQLIFGEETYKEGVDLTAEAFYQKMNTSTILPKSSQPAVGDFVNLYEELKKEYEIGIAIHASSALTGTYQASVQAAEMAGFPLIAIDSKIGSYPLNKMIQMAIQYEQEGLEAEDIAEKVRHLAENTELHLLPANLDQLKRSGRLSGAQAILGALLKMNLIIKFDDGKVVLSEKIRTEKKAKAHIFDLITKHIDEMDELCVIHAGDEEKANLWREELHSIYPDLSIQIMILCPVAGVHTGYQTLGFGWIKKSAY